GQRLTGKTDDTVVAQGLFDGAIALFGQRLRQVDVMDGGAHAAVLRFDSHGGFLDKHYRVWRRIVSTSSASVTGRGLTASPRSCMTCLAMAGRSAAVSPSSDRL